MVANITGVWQKNEVINSLFKIMIQFMAHPGLWLFFKGKREHRNADFSVWVLIPVPYISLIKHRVGHLHELLEVP